MTTTDTLNMLPIVQDLNIAPMTLAHICQRWFIMPERLAEAARLPVPIIADALCGKTITQEAARRLIFGLFLITGWLWTQRDILDLCIKKPTLAELLNRHNLTSVTLAQQSGVPLLAIHDMLRRRPVAPLLAYRVLAAFTSFGYEYHMDNTDILTTLEV